MITRRRACNAISEAVIAISAAEAEKEIKVKRQKLDDVVKEANKKKQKTVLSSRKTETASETMVRRTTRRTSKQPQKRGRKRSISTSSVILKNGTSGSSSLDDKQKSGEKTRKAKQVAVDSSKNVKPKMTATPSPFEQQQQSGDCCSYWIVKSEPDEWSWDMHVQAGHAPWDGVRNPQAANFLRVMNVGDRVLFYHSGVSKSGCSKQARQYQKCIMGSLTVVSAAEPDPNDPTGKFVRVHMDAQVSQQFATPVSLATIKNHPDLQHLTLLRQPRLSVSPVDAFAWNILLDLGDRNTNAAE